MTDAQEDEWGRWAVSEKEGLEVISKAYDWSIASDGTVFGLVAGDMGYEATHIVIPEDHVKAMVKYYHFGDEDK